MGKCEGEAKMTHLYSFVHCHVCPLKDLCNVGDHEKSFQYHNRYDEGGAKYAGDMAQITLSCYLRKLMVGEQ